MASSKPRAAYTSDQRNLMVSIWASRTGGTDYHVYWRHCLAGEENLREVTLLRGHWRGTLSAPSQGIRALVWIARAMERHAAAKDEVS